jgi:hypothetical protein
MRSDYQRNQQLAQGMAQFQPVQNGGLAGALAQGLAGFGTGYYGGKAQNQRQQVSQTIADALAKGDMAAFNSALLTSGIPEYETVGISSQMKQAEEANKRKMIGEMLGTVSGDSGGDRVSKLAQASVMYPELKPILDLELNREKQTKEDAKFPDTQAGASGFANRMAKAEKLIKEFEGTGYDPSKDSQSYYGSKIPIAGNFLKSPEYQKYEQAASDWIRSKLRKESGAVIGKDEMAQEFATYFPMPGDSPEVVAQKAKARGEGFNQMVAQAGNAYKTQFGGENPYIKLPITPDQVANPAGQPTAPEQQGVDPNLSSAAQAIQAGAPKDAVRQRLLQSGYSPEQLKGLGL